MISIPQSVFLVKAFYLSQSLFSIIYRTGVQCNFENLGQVRSGGNIEWVKDVQELCMLTLLLSTQIGHKDGSKIGSTMLFNVVMDVILREVKTLLPKYKTPICFSI